MKKHFHLFWIFFKIGLFTFGGGYAMVSLIEEEIVKRNRWLKEEEFIDILAIVQTFPGAIAINLANYIGRSLFGTMGAIIAVAGATIPSLLVILLISMFYVQFAQQQWWDKFVNGLLPVVLALIIKAGVNFYKTTVKNKLDFAFFGIAFIAIFLGIHPLVVIFAAGTLGLIRQRSIVRKLKEKTKDKE